MARALTVSLAILSMTLAMGTGQPTGYAPVVPLPRPAPGPGLLATLPLASRALKAVSADLGAYSIFECSGNNMSRACGLSETLFSRSSIQDPPPNSIIEYGEVTSCRNGPSFRERCNDLARF
jgi:hypothetical protein